MAEVISLEAPLVEHWQRALQTAETMYGVAESNLARLALTYSGQLTLELEIPTQTPPEAA